MMVKPCDQNQKTQDTTKYKGVRKRKWGKWVSEIRLPNSRKRIWLGSYDSAQKAARAFDAAMFCLRGRNATFNFPDNPPDIAGGRSMTPSQIQAAAAEFANGGAHEGCSGGAEGPSRDASVVETHKGSLTDVLTPVGSGNYGSEYGIFRGFDDLGGEFYVPEMANVSYGEDHGEGLIVDESFLWNF